MPDVVIPSSGAAILSMLSVGDPKVVKQENFLATANFLERSGLAQIVSGSTLHTTFMPGHPGGICIELTDKGLALAKALDTAKEVWPPQPARTRGKPRRR